MYQTYRLYTLNYAMLHVSHISIFLKRQRKDQLMAIAGHLQSVCRMAQDAAFSVSPGRGPSGNLNQ